MGFTVWAVERCLNRVLVKLKILNSWNLESYKSGSLNPKPRKSAKPKSEALQSCPWRCSLVFGGFRGLSKPYARSLGFRV